MMNHYKAERLPVEEAAVLYERAKSITEGMEIKPMISRIDKRHRWNEEKKNFEVAEQELVVIGYFHNNEIAMTEKLAEFMDLKSSF